MLGADGYHMRMAKACNAEEFIKFPKEVNEICHKMTVILNNASYHKAKAVRKFGDGTGGDIELIFLPAYPPPAQLDRDSMARSQAAAAQRVLCLYRGAGSGHNVAGRQAPDASGQDYEIRDTRLRRPADARMAMIHSPPMACFS